ncbi:MAG: right-handed parallel beta-helix repeat-containing protein [Bacteroidia bacterium]|nr:right-handed parallel beta-helix repeat-containing protein [Bacteroidia bacterium]
MQPQFCCQPVDDDFIKIPSDISNVISTNTTFHGKYWVEPGTILQVTSGATLDLTNVDMVFSPGAGMESYGSSVRANNSVFRPCDEAQTWKGITIRDNSSGNFNECTFKNGSFGALYLFDSDGHLTDNEFYNCQQAIGLALDPNFKGDITGNTIVWDEHLPDFPTGITTEFNGLVAFGSNFKGLVSGNHFSNGVVTDPLIPNTMFGIRLDASIMTATENLFTNIHQAIEGSNLEERVEFSENEISYTEGIDPYIHAVRFTDVTAPVLFHHNEMKHLNPEVYSEAIYLERVNMGYFGDNEIEGFGVGIRMNDSKNTSIVENKLSGILDLGIGSYESYFGIEIARNTIELKKNEGGGTIGLEYILNSYYPDAFLHTEIVRNCILETGTAMYFYSGTVDNPFPVITDNYLYNYETIGMYFENFVGTIGTGVGGREFGGRNAFISNWQDFASTGPFVADVFETGGGIVLYGNYHPKNSMTVVGNVTRPARTMYVPLATCAGMIQDNTINRIQENVYRDLVTQNLPLEWDGMKYVLLESFRDWMDKDNLQLNFLVTAPVSTVLLQNSDRKEWNRFMNLLKIENHLNGPQLLALELMAAQKDLDLVRAAQITDDLKGIGGFWSDFAMLNKIKLDRQDHTGSWNQLTDSERAWLLALAESNSILNDLAWDMIHAIERGHPFRYNDRIRPSIGNPQIQGSLEMGIPSITVWPNPGSGNLTLTFSAPDAEGSVDLKVTGVDGKVWFQSQLDVIAGNCKADLSKLADGVYFLTIQGEETAPMTVKYVKY